LFIGLSTITGQGQSLKEDKPNKVARILWFLFSAILFLHAFNIFHFIDFLFIRNFFGISFEYFIVQFAIAYYLIFAGAFIGFLIIIFFIIVIIIPGWLYVLSDKFNDNSIFSQILRWPLALSANPYFESLFNYLFTTNGHWILKLGNKLLNISENIMSGLSKFSIACALAIIFGFISNIVFSTGFILGVSPGTYYLISALFCLVIAVYPWHIPVFELIKK